MFSFPTYFSFVFLIQWSLFVLGIDFFLFSNPCVQYLTASTTLFFFDNMHMHRFNTNSINHFGWALPLDRVLVIKRPGWNYSYQCQEQEKDRGIKSCIDVLQNKACQKRNYSTNPSHDEIDRFSLLLAFKVLNTGNPVG